MKDFVIPSLNIWLFVVGGVLMSAGLFLTFPLKFDRTFFWQNGPLIAMLAVGTFYLFRTRRSTDFLTWWRPIGHEWLRNIMLYWAKFMPLMLLLVAVMALGLIVMKLYRADILTFMKAHHVLAPLVGAAVTPSSNSMIPIVEALWEDGAMRPMCLYFLQASALMSFPLFMLRQTGISNIEMATKMYISGCLVAICMLPLAIPTSRLTDRIYDLGPSAWHSLELAGSSVAYKWHYILRAFN